MSSTTISPELSVIRITVRVEGLEKYMKFLLIERERQDEGYETNMERIS